jgi:hypothetical protein
MFRELVHLRIIIPLYFNFWPTVEIGGGCARIISLCRIRSEGLAIIRYVISIRLRWKMRDMGGISFLIILFFKVLA